MGLLIMRRFLLLLILAGLLLHPANADEVLPAGRKLPSGDICFSGYCLLKKSGDTITGPLGLTLPGGATSQILQQTLAEVGALYSFGYIGDGTSHPLSSVTSFNGISSAGWTLARWQTYFPFATALSNEIDRLAIQSVVNNASIKPSTGNLLASGVSIELPASAAIIDAPIVSCVQSINLRGKSEKLTSITQITAGADGWQHCPTSPNPSAPPSAPPGQTVRLADLSLYCGSPAGCGTGISLQAGADVGWNHLDRIAVTPNSAGYQWTTGIHTFASSKTVMRDIVVNGSFTPNNGLGTGNAASGSSLTNKGIVVESVNYNGTGTPANARLANASFGTFIYNAELYGWGTCYEFDTKSYNGVEGAYLFQSSCDASNVGVNQTNSIYNGTTQQYQAPIYQLTNNQIHVAGQGAKFYGAAQVYLAGNTFFPDPGSVSLDFLRFAFTSDVIVNDNTFNFYPNDAISTLLSFATAVNVDIHDNLIDNGFNSLTVGTAAIFVDSASTFVHEHDNQFFNWPAEKPLVVNQSTNGFNRLASQYRGFPAGIDSAGQVSFRQLTPSLSIGAGGVVTLSWPLGLFLTTPIVSAQVAANSYTGVCTYNLGGSTNTTASFICAINGTPSSSGSVSLVVDAKGL